MHLNSSIYESISKGSTVIALSVAVLGLIFGLLTSKEFDLKVKDEISSIVIDVGGSQSRFIDLESSVSAIKAQLEGIKKLPDDIPVSAKLGELEARIVSIDKKLDSLNKAIMESPEKALALPLLRRDMDSLQKQYVAAVTGLEQEVSRAYDIFKWVTGSMFLGVISLAVGVFLRPKG